MADDAPIGLPPKDAIEYFRAKGLKPGFSYLDVWREEHAASFTIAKAMQLDVLTTLREAVDKAIAEGATFGQFSADLTPLLQSLGWWGKKDVVDPLTGEKIAAQLGSPERLKLIYDANLRSARAAGQWERIQRTKSVLPYLLYLLGPSREHRLQHVRWAGLLLPVEDPFWKTATPPNGWGCRCHLRQVSRLEAEKLRTQGQVHTQSPPFQMREVVNRRTGETLQVPVGIDPGWDFNPGERRLAAVLDVLRQKLPVADVGAARAAISQTLSSPDFGYWLDNPTGAWPVAIMNPVERQALRTEQSVVLLSDETMSKQLRHHPDLTQREYRVLDQLVERAEVIVRQGELRLVFFRQFGRLYKAVVKTTADRQELYLVSYQRADEQEMRREIRRGELLIQ